MKRLFALSLFATLLMAIATMVMAIMLYNTTSAGHHNTKAIAQKQVSQTEPANTQDTPSETSTASAQGSAKNKAPASLRVNFYLAQDQQADGLQALRVNNNAIWVNPNPILVKSDIRVIGAFKTDKNQPYIRFRFSDNASNKLGESTKDAAGKKILVVVGNQVLGATSIDKAITNGRINVNMPTQKQAQQVAQQIVDSSK